MSYLPVLAAGGPCLPMAFTKDSPRYRSRRRYPTQFIDNGRYLCEVSAATIHTMFSSFLSDKEIRHVVSKLQLVPLKGVTAS